MACMVLFMAYKPNQQLAENVSIALRVSATTQARMAKELNIGVNTFRRRLADGRFTFGQLAVIADTTGTELLHLIPVTEDLAS